MWTRPRSRSANASVWTAASTEREVEAGAEPEGIQPRVGALQHPVSGPGHAAESLVEQDVDRVAEDQRERGRAGDGAYGECRHQQQRERVGWLVWTLVARTA